MLAMLLMAHSASAITHMSKKLKTNTSDTLSKEEVKSMFTMSLMEATQEILEAEKEAEKRHKNKSNKPTAEA